MMPGRRLTAVIALGLLALTGLVACRSDPAVAAYVGDTEITERQVDEVVTALRSSFEAELETELEALEGTASEETIAEHRQQRLDAMAAQLLVARDRVAVFFVLNEAGSRYVAAESLALPEPPVAEAAQALAPLPEDHPYVLLIADFLAVTRALQEVATPVEPSGADRREVYENLRLNDQPVDVPFEEVAPLLTADLLAGPVGVRDLLRTVLERADVRVQPGYDLVYEVPVQVSAATSFLGVRISEPSAVVDAD
jgi:parvulin-like peptidyl-prolyl isomerase